ncbi:MAG: fluoride efflux transporter CrcB [Bacteroidota bacterium]
MNFLYVFLGGGLGSICRYGIAVVMKSYHLTFPYATLIANILSCIVLGYLVALTQRSALSSTYALIFATGFCGGFSTFSTFSVETFALFSNGHPFLALANIGFSLLVCLGAIYLGMKLGG